MLRVMGEQLILQTMLWPDEIRAAVDEFVGVVLKGYTGMRWGEIVGLETQYVSPKTKTIRVEWQLYELDSGVLHRCPPKED